MTTTPSAPSRAVLIITGGAAALATLGVGLALTGEDPDTEAPATPAPVVTTTSSRSDVFTACAHADGRLRSDSDGVWTCELPAVSPTTWPASTASRSAPEDPELTPES